MTTKKTLFMVFVLALALSQFSCTEKKGTEYSSETVVSKVRLNLENMGSYTQVIGGPCAVCPDAKCDNCKTNNNPIRKLTILNLNRASRQFDLDQEFTFYGYKPREWTNGYSIMLSSANCRRTSNGRYVYDVDPTQW